MLGLARPPILRGPIPLTLRCERSEPRRAGDRAPQDEGAEKDSAKPSAAYVFRSTISSLMRPIALAGFSPFGQTFAQFMMVWQR